MKNTSLAIILLIFIITANAQNHDIIWQNSYGGSLFEEANAACLTTDNGYVIGGGTFSNDGDVSGNHGNRDFWVIKLDTLGVLQWQKCIGGSSNDRLYGINNTSDGGVIASGHSSSCGSWHADAKIVKLDSLGNIQWSKCLGGSENDGVNYTMETFDGGYISGGWSLSDDGDVTLNQGLKDCWVIKLDSMGNIQWQKTFGGSLFEDISMIIQLADSSYIFTGYSNSTDGDLTNNHGGDDVWVVKLDANGNMEWEHSYGGTATDHSSCVTSSINGGYTISALTLSNNGDVSGNHGDFDVWIFEIDSSGNLLWQKCYGGSAMDEAKWMVKTPDGGNIITGFSKSYDGDVTGNHGETDCWVIKTDIIGNLEWQRCYGGSDGEIGRSIFQNATGNHVIASWSSSNDGDVTGNHGDVDFWVFEIGSLSYDTIHAVVCDSYISPSGKKFLNTGIYYDTLINITGNDSIIVIDLTVNKSSDHWQQIGQDIFGENEDNMMSFELDISPDGDIIALRGNTPASQNSDSCYVQVMKNVNGMWVQKGQKIFTDDKGNNFGYSIRMSSDGNILAVGAIYHKTYGLFTGRVYAYEYDNGIWIQKGQILDGEAGGDFFGSSVSLSAGGNILAVGIPGHDGGGQNNGCVKVFEFLNDNWVQFGQNINGEAPGDVSGGHICLSDDGLRIAIGAVQNDGNGSQSGHVRIYEFFNGSWVQLGQDLDGEYAGENFGISVDMASDGNIVAIGGYLNMENGSGSGHTCVYEYVNGSWVQIGQDIDGEGIQDWSGTDVRLSSDGKILAVNASRNDGNGTNSGHVRVFENINDEWIQLGRSILGDAAGNLAGSSIGLSADGLILAVGAPHNNENGYHSGQVRIFQNNIVKIDTTICDSIISPSGLYVWDTNGVYFDTIATIAGCDSVIRFNLFVNHSSFSYDTLTACDSLQWINGITYFESTDSATHVIPNSTGCDSIITLNLTIHHSPVANAGDDDEICSYEEYTLNGSATNEDYTYWATMGDGEFDDRFILDATYTPGPQDIQDGYVSLILIAYALSPCTGETADTMQLTINHIATADAGPDGSTCQNNPYTLNGVVEYNSGQQWLTTGDGSFDNDTLLTASYTPGPNDVVNGEVEIILTAFGTVQCDLNATDTMLLQIGLPPAIPGIPDGPDFVDVTITPSSEFAINTVENATEYKWHISPSDAGEISGSDTTGLVVWNSEFTGLLATVSVEAMNTCCPSSFSDELTVNIGHVGINEDIDDGFSVVIAPNPSNGLVNAIIKGAGERVEMYVLNSEGLLMHSENLTHSENVQSYSIDIGEFVPGIYYFKFTSAERMIIKKVVKR